MNNTFYILRKRKLKCLEIFEAYRIKHRWNKNLFMNDQKQGNFIKTNFVA